MTSTKFLLALAGVLGLLVAAYIGKFTGELGLYVAGIVASYVTGNTMITRAALMNGKDANGVKVD